jgi:hypothetical protein
MQSSEWIKTGGNHDKKLPKLSFPLQGAMPEIYVPDSTCLLLQNDVQIHVWLWCYLERKKNGKSGYLFKPSSLSAQRVKDLPRAVERLSKRYRFDNTKPPTVKHELTMLSAFLYWIDDPRHQRRYESILSDPDLALDALKKYHTHLRQRMQTSHTDQCISEATASRQDGLTIKTMAEIHDRIYRNEIEPITYRPGEGVKAPKTGYVGTFMACMEGIFDSVSRIVIEGTFDNDGKLSLGDLCWQSSGQECSVPIPAGSHIERVMELGCIAYAALCIGDSGANLAQIQAFEEPEDLYEQLAKPEKLNLRLKTIKLRAGGKVVPLHLTATTVTRLEAYLNLREALRLRLDCPDIGPMFVQCKYGASDAFSRPIGITRLAYFTTALRRKLRLFGIELPPVTMQQLRAHKQGALAKKHNPKVVASMMGNSVATAIRYYNKITKTARRLEMAPFMTSLTSVVLTRAKENEKGSKSTTPLIEIPPGRCEDHGHPKAKEVNPLVKPDCKKTEGCFFCDNFHVHADETDATKLMSCRYVLERLTPGLGDSGAAEKVYDAVLSRVNALLNEIKQIDSEAHERARQAAQDEGNLSPYWAAKLQQLHMLGLIPPTAPESERSIQRSHSA